MYKQLVRTLLLVAPIFMANCKNGKNEIERAFEDLNSLEFRKMQQANNRLLSLAPESIPEISRFIVTNKNNAANVSAWSILVYWNSEVAITNVPAALNNRSNDPCKLLSQLEARHFESATVESTKSFLLFLEKYRTNQNVLSPHERAKCIEDAMAHARKRLESQ